MNLRPRMRRLFAVLSLSIGLCGIAALSASAATTTASGDRTAPRVLARPALGPLAVSVASFIGQNLAAGVISSVGGTAFGAVLAESGFAPDQTGAQTLAALKEVGVKLDRIEVSIDSLKGQVAALTTTLANARLNALRQSANELTGRVDAAVVLLKNLASGQYADPTLRAEKRQELLTLIGTKIKDEQNFLVDLILSPRSTDDIMHAAYSAERTGHRFWTDTDGRAAASIVGYYQNLVSIVLMLRVEYEWSTVRANSTPAYIDGKRAEVKRSIDAYYAAIGRIGQAYPRLLGSYEEVIDTKTDLIWSSPRLGIYQQDWLTPITTYNTLPSIAQFRALVAGRTNNQVPSAYLVSQGWTLPTSCNRDPQDYRQKPFAASETVFWTSDVSGGRRYAWAMHDDGTGQLARACIMTVRPVLTQSERFWY